ncbi:MAG: helix-turn-helix domain-containing protein [Thermoguttaceae bacterium]|nr:helix-turn-helix domain-containing protein [Thermoguttaceae bacterium]
MLNQGVSIREIARRFSIAPSTVFRVKNGTIKRKYTKIYRCPECGRLWKTTVVHNFCPCCNYKSPGGEMPRLKGSIPRHLGINLKPEHQQAYNELHKQKMESGEPCR